MFSGTKFVQEKYQKPFNLILTRKKIHQIFIIISLILFIVYSCIKISRIDLNVIILITTWIDSSIINFLIKNSKNILFFASLALLIFTNQVFIWLIARKYSVNKNTKEIEHIKMMTLREQMNPHFIFNTIHAIQDYILSAKTEQAYNYLSRFSKMLRFVLHTTESNTSNLSDEIEFIKLYLSLAKLRFGNKLNYTIIVNKSIQTNSIVIPSMIIQPHVENSITHGIANKKGSGTIYISFNIINKKLVVEIDDDGIGRKKANEIAKKQNHNKHNKIAHNNIQDRLKVLGLKSDDYLIIDKSDNSGNPTGTKTVIKFTI